MRALITGGSGFVGSHLCEHLRAAGDEVVVTDATSNAAGVLPLDISDRANFTEVIRARVPEVVYHLAAISFVPDADRDFRRALDINIGGVVNLFDACAALDRPVTIIVASSAEAYGRINPTDLPITESVALRPGNHYALTKAMAELVPARFGHTKIRAVIARPFNHIGPRQRPQFAVSSFALQLARIKCKKAPPTIKVGNLEAKRDFSDVRDIVRAYRLMAEKGSGLFNLGAGKSYRVGDVLSWLIELSGCKVTVEQDPTRMRAAEVPDLYASCARAERELGWRPTIDIQTSLRDVLEWWVSEINAGRDPG